MQTKHPGWQQFLTLCQQAQTDAELDALFQFLLTHEEQAQMADRVLLTQALLKEDRSQRQISSDLDISIAKITRGSNALKAIPAQLKQFLLANL